MTVVGLEEQRSPRSRSRDFFALWQVQDARLFEHNLEAAGQRGHEELPTDIVDFARSQQKFFPKLDGLISATDDDSTDVIIWLLAGPPPSQLLDKARLGVWSLSTVENEVIGFWELIDRIPIVTCELFTSQASPARRRTLHRAFAKTDHLSYTRTLLRVRAINESLIVSTLDEIRHHGEVTSKLPPIDHRVTNKAGRPGPFRLIGALCLLYGRYLISVATRRFHRDQWQLAYRIGGDRYSRHDMSRLAPQDNGFWADPFVVRRENRTVMYFEEMEDRNGKGRILAIEILPDGCLGPPEVVLDLDHHLSYPFLFEYEDSLYMIPESADAGRVEAFRCTEFPYRWEPHAVLLDDVRAFDATLLRHDDLWWMFVTIQHNGNTSCDELHLFHSSDPFSKWIPHRANPVSLDIRCARPGGAIFEHEGQLYRPAQDCSERYGYALVIQRITTLNTDDYQEETVQELLPNWADDVIGTHTINQVAGVTVYDCLVRRRK